MAEGPRYTSPRWPEQLGDLSCAICSILPVTALCYLPGTSILLAGRGQHLSIYECKTSRLLWEKRVVEGVNVNGFLSIKQDPSAWLALLWAGRTVTVLTIRVERRDDVENKVLVSLDVTCDGFCVCEDYIIDCAICPVLDPRLETILFGAAVTAHNALLSLKICKNASSIDRRSQGATIVQEPLTSATPVLLYAAHLLWLKNGRIYVAAGTAFGTVILYSYGFGLLTSGIPSRSITHSEFQAHDGGSVFGVKILEHAFAHTRNNQGPSSYLIATCSDDRSIKIWDINDPTNEDASGASQPYHQARGATLLTAAPPGDPRYGIGHISRLWGITEVQVDDKQSLLVSHGEDATVQIWRQAGGVGASRSGVILHHVQTLYPHSGKNVWSFTARAYDEEQVEVASGGADGRVALSRLRLSQGGDSEETGNRNEISSQDGSLLQRKSSADSVFRSYCFIGHSAVIATTSTGGIALRNFSSAATAGMDSAAMIVWREIDQRDDLKGYSLAAGLPQLGLAFVAGARGQLLAIRSGNVCPIAHRFPVGSTKLAGLFCSASQKSTKQADHKVAVFTLHLNHSTGHCLVLSSDAIREGVSPEAELSLKLPSTFTVTSFLYSHSLDHCCSALLGSRDGRVAIYDALSPEPATCAPTAVLHDHADAITSLRLRVGEEDAYHLICTSRDGSYSIRELQDWHVLDGTPFSTTLLHHASLPGKPSIEGHFFQDSGKVCFYGFQSEHFIVYSESACQELWRVHCGGAHRIWSFAPPDTSAKRIDFLARLVWNKAAACHAAAASLDSTSFVQEGGHGREIKACAASPVPALIAGKLVRLVATGAEDTDIRLWEVAREHGDGKPDMRCVGVLRGHNTGIQHLHWSADGKYLFSCGGSEEFLIWRISRAPWVDIGFTLEARLPTVDRLVDLRVMGFDVLTEKDETGFLVAIALSNGSIRVYRYTTPRSKDRSKQSWRLVSSKPCSKHCLTALSFLSRANPPTDFQVFLAIASTDGTLSTWMLANAGAGEGECVMHLMKRTRLHQSSVKDMQIVQCPLGDPTRQAYMMVTVGDDNALGATLLRLDAGLPRTASTTKTSDMQQASLLLPRAHAASATAVTVLPDQHVRPSNSSTHVMRLATTGTDQTFRTWELTVDLSKPGASGINIESSEVLSSAVADAACLIALPDLASEPETAGTTLGNMSGATEVLLCGVGMEVWNI